MSVIYKVITRPTDPRVPNSPKRYYPHLITLLRASIITPEAREMADLLGFTITECDRFIFRGDK